MFPASCKVLLTTSSPDRWGPIAVVKGLRTSSALDRLGDRCFSSCNKDRLCLKNRGVKSGAACGRTAVKEIQSRLNNSLTSKLPTHCSLLTVDCSLYCGP
jgi:hypothetical protein